MWAKPLLLCWQVSCLVHLNCCVIYFFLISDTPKRAEEIAKVVSVQYGEPTGPPLLTTKDAVDKEAFFVEPQVNMSSGDAKSKYYFISCCADSSMFVLSLNFSCYI